MVMQNFLGKAFFGVCDQGVDFDIFDQKERTLFHPLEGAAKVLKAQCSKS